MMGPLLQYYNGLLPDAPSTTPGDAPYTLNRMFTSWVTVIMLPTALITYYTILLLSSSQTTSTSTSTSNNFLSTLTALSFMAWPIIGMMQGTILLCSFRYRFGKAPPPHTPAHGVVVVHPKDYCTSTASSLAQQQQDDNNNHVVSMRLSGLTHTDDDDDGCCCAGGSRWRHRRRRPTTHLTSSRAVHDDGEDDSTRIFLQDALLQQQPLRLLVMGDSLALGVGVHESCTAILPEALAKTLSKQMNGRPVEWTCHGSPGASAGWIVRELQRETGLSPLEQQQQQTTNERAVVRKNTASNNSSSTHPPGLDYSDSSSEDSSSVESESVTSADDDEASSSSRNNSSNCASSTSSNTVADWRRRLLMSSHRRFDASSTGGPYDIVVVMTGPNDVKSAVLPFLVHPDEAEVRKDAKSRGDGGLTSELELVLETLGPRMRAAATSKKGNNNTQLPLVVFPGMPTALLPIFQQLPIRWMAIPVSGIMDQHKVELSKKEHEKVKVMYVEPPSVAIASDFEAQRGLYWDQRLKEDTLLALRNVTKQDCESKTRTMRAYYESKTNKYALPCYPPSQALTQANIPFPPLSERRGNNKDGSKIVCMDGVHPNDEGYDMWGRHIAHGILEQWAM